jgi:hypothetical protein
MLKMLVVAAAAFTLSAAPALACPDCKDCPHHKVAAAEKKDGDAKVGCPCAKGEECKCAAKCECPHCSAKKAKKDEAKKS